MAKLNYVEGDYKEALNIYARVGLDDVPLTAAAPYRLRMIAEAFATKGEARAPLPSPREGCPRVVLFGASRASRSVHFDPHGPGWRLTQTTPSKASGLAPLCVILRPATHRVFRASVLQSSLKEMKEKRFSHFLIINMQLSGDFSW